MILDSYVFLHKNSFGESENNPREIPLPEGVTSKKALLVSLARQQHLLRVTHTENCKRLLWFLVTLVSYHPEIVYLRQDRWSADNKTRKIRFLRR